jgi:predicted enzyme related to lactoylglutathione lyase
MSDILVNIDVDDLQKAIAFYTAAFEWRVGRSLGDDFAELLGASSRIYLLPKASGTAPCAGDVRRYTRHWTPVHIDVVVEDIDAAVARAVAAGANRESEITTHPYGKLAFFSDPFGNGFCLLQFTGRGYDELLTDSSSTD